jgi:hypothetical protein
MPTDPVHHYELTGVTRGPTLLIAAGFVIATTAAALNITGHGAMNNVLRALGFGHNPAVAAAPRPQAVALTTLEDRLSLALMDIDTLKARPSRGATDPAVEARLNRMDSGLAKLLSASSKLLEAQSNTSEELGHIRAALANADIGIAQLRASIDEGSARQRNAVADINGRIDQLEHAASRNDATGSVHSGKARRRARAVASIDPRTAGRP